MCVTCGCSSSTPATLTDDQGTVTIPTAAPTPAHSPDHLHSDHLHDHPHDHSHSHVLDDGTVLTHSHADSPAPSPADASPAAHHAHVHRTTLSLEQHLLAKNNAIAQQNRTWLSDRQILALNLVSSPGSGKTTLLVRTIQDLIGQRAIAVIEGDQETSHDADRIRATGAPAVQVNTGTGCHLEAHMVQQGIQHLNPPSQSLLLIENVGNLVCPALFDLGETAKVAILSVTEGEDKPIKYPHMFRASQVMILTKIDLLPYLNFDVDRCLHFARQVNPHLTIFQVSATTGAGLSQWYDWLHQQFQPFSSQSSSLEES